MDIDQIFSQAEQGVNTCTAIGNKALPKASFGGAVVSHVDVRAGAAVIVEGKQGSGFVTMHINMTMEQYFNVMKQLKSDGATVSESFSTRNGYSARRIELPNTDTEEFGF